MIYVLIGLLTVFLWLNFNFGGEDFFSPATVQILTFLGSAMMCNYFMWSMNAPYEFHWETVIIIVLAMGLTSVIGIVVHQLFTRITIQAHMPEDVNISPISGMASTFLAGIILFTIGWLLLEIRRLGGTTGSFYEMMNRFHARNFYATDESGRFPWILNQLLGLLRVLFLIYGFNLIRFFDKFTLAQKCVNLLILGLCCLGLLLTGRRLPTVNQLLACFMMFQLFRIQKEGKCTKYSLGSLTRIVLLLLLLMTAFFLVKSFVGRASRNEIMNFADYISYYTGTQYIALDRYFQNPPYKSNILGKETFTSLNQFLISHKLIDLPMYSVPLEFRSVGAGYANNVYTFLRAYHYDFGIIGTYLLHGISILFLSVFYEYVKKRRGNIGILIFGQMYYSIVMSFFTERFYADIISFNFLKLLAMMLILYEFLIRKRIRFKFCRTAHLVGFESDI